MMRHQGAGAAVRVGISISGIVQGVGFRPFVFNLAERLGVRGWVRNDSSGVEIEAEGDPETLELFARALRDEAPPLARIETFRISEREPLGEGDFSIRHSQRQKAAYQLISPDIATCNDCLHELLDPADRRYRYPFTNCTNCGPRFTIIQDIPYDRDNTTMRVFPMCPDCQREYEDPRNRRFHAQPNACPICGPSLELIDNHQGQLEPVRSGSGHGDVLDQAVAMLLQGDILAIKGLGGFHLACDATNAQAVQTLRERKHRPDKPFALMMPTLEMVRAHCDLGPAEELLLTSPQSPIVLLPWRADSDVARVVAPHYGDLGVMLPYTPLHHLLLRGVGRPLVMTSGNLSEEPIAADNQEAMERLGPLADALILHNREIYARYDDSVWFLSKLPAIQGQEDTSNRDHAQPLRRARGYAPSPIKLPFALSQILACGPEIKNTFCLTRDAYAFISQHIGDMENLETLEHYERTVALYERQFRIQPQTIACDLHPDYMATRYAQQRAAALGAPAVGVQHHHAHIAACLADNGWAPEDGKVIGVALDGTGYGPDGRIWGGEWLLADYAGYQRLAHLEYLPLPGGDAATRNPWRIAYAYGYTLLGQAPDVEWPDAATPQVLGLLRQQLDRRVRCPLTSSMGRLFDAVSALLGVCQATSYDAQAAIELEHLATTSGGHGDEGYGAVWRDNAGAPETDAPRVVRVAGLWQAILADMRADVPVADIAWRFHRAIAEMTVDLCAHIAAETGVHIVALSGGCFQNRLLLSMTVERLQCLGLRVLLHQQVPCNDGGLSLGQAVIAQFAQDVA